MSSKYQKRRMLSFGVFSIVIIAMVLFRFINYKLELVEKEKEIQMIEEQLEKLKEEEEVLGYEVDKLQDPGYLLRYAREQYLYSNENEIIFTLPKDE